jgi:hypothetical protein
MLLDCDEDRRVEGWSSFSRHTEMSKAGGVAPAYAQNFLPAAGARRRQRDITTLRVSWEIFFQLACSPLFWTDTLRIKKRGIAMKSGSKGNRWDDCEERLAVFRCVVRSPSDLYIP